MTNEEREQMKSANPEQADIDRTRKEDGKQPEKANSNEKPGEIADTVPEISEDDLKPDSGDDEAGPEKADVERAKRERGK